MFTETLVLSDSQKLNVWKSEKGVICLWMKIAVHHRGNHPDDGGGKDFWNIGNLLPDYTMLQPRRQASSRFYLWIRNMQHFDLAIPSSGSEKKYFLFRTHNVLEPPPPLHRSNNSDCPKSTFLSGLILHLPQYNTMTSLYFNPKDGGSSMFSWYMTTKLNNLMNVLLRTYSSIPY